MAEKKDRRRTAFLIISIILMLVGTGLCLFPIIKQAYNSHLQKEMMDDIKQQILENYDVEASADNTSSQNGASTNSGSTVDTDDVSGTTEPAENALIPDSLAGGLTEVEEVVEEDRNYEKSRLRGQKCLGIITIPEIDLVYAIVEGVDDDNIGVAIGHFPDSAGIGADGNCSLAGHNGGYSGRYFGDIDELSIGSEIIMTDLKGLEYTYKVTQRFVVEPTEVSVVGPLSESGKFLTLVTCCNSGTKRYIVRAECTTEPESMTVKE